MKTFSELENYIKTLPSPPEKYKVAVGSLIFNDNGRVILLERGAGARDEQGNLD